MAEMWKPKDPKILRTWLGAIEVQKRIKLTHWEKEFIQNIKLKLSRGWQLSQDQEYKLEQIYAEKTD